MDIIIQRFVREDEIYNILKDCHDESCGGHFVDKMTTYMVLPLGYYWPNMSNDAKTYVRSCNSCQRMGQLAQSNEMPV